MYYTIYMMHFNYWYQNKKKFSSLDEVKKEAKNIGFEVLIFKDNLPLATCSPLAGYKEIVYPVLD